MPVSDHTQCNAWCTGATHAHLLLISGDITTLEEWDARNMSARYEHLHAVRIISLRPAPEADKEALIDHKLLVQGISSRGNIRIMGRQELEQCKPWLVIYAEVPHET